MKLQIKTLNQKSLMVDIDATKTVYELKKELSLYPDVGVKPELQKLIYAGKILLNGEPLSAYNIDAKKFLVVMVLKQPEDSTGLETEPSGAASSAATATATSATTTAAATAGAAAIARAAAGSTSTAPKKESTTVKAETTTTTAATTPPTTTTTTPAATVTAAAAQDSTPSTPTPQRAAAGADATPQRQPAQPTSGVNDEMVANIVCMGYPEAEVRQALAASFNNPERAIEYLIEGIPDSILMQPEDAVLYGGEGSDAGLGMSPFEMFRSDPLFRNLRRAIQQHPELINDAIQRVGEANPAILQLINENQQEFLSSLIEGSDDDDDEEEGGGGGAPGSGRRN